MFRYRKNNKIPDYSFSSVSEITPEFIENTGASAVAIDLDNTMVKDKSFHMPRKSREWIKKIREKNIPVIIITNTFILRALFLSAKIGGLPVVPLANKPSVYPMLRASKRLRISPDRLLMIGDRADKDVLSANRAGAISVMVEKAPD